MPSFLFLPWPWYIAGPLIGLLPAVLLLIGNRMFGMSSNLRHLCAAILPPRFPYFQYDWRKDGGWNLLFALGTITGGFIAGTLLRNPQPVAIAETTREALSALGVHDFSGIVPRELFTWSMLTTLRGWALIAGGGFLVGFGTSYAGGCTSGHALSGIANLQPASLVAMLAFFAGGIVGTFALLPVIL